MTDNNGYVLSPLPVAPVNETDMLLLPEGLNALKKVATIDHHSGEVLAYVFGRRQDQVFLQLQALLEPFGISRYYTDGWGTYERHVEAETHTVGKEHMQRIESKHINLRTRIKRLVRRTICFSKTEHMHDLVIGLFINRYEFGRAI
jgi:insertion element IS1 protein InsB